MNQVSVFISHSFSDNKYIDLIKSIEKNPNNPLRFHDNSLLSPVYNSYGHINRRKPSDPLAKKIKYEINILLRNTDKLLVLVGNDTHSKDWVSWEINSFISCNKWENVLMMCTPDNNRGGKPKTDKDLKLHAWNINELTTWIFT